MRCLECDRILADDSTACVCGWRGAALVVATDWIDQTCSTVGCTVVIRSHVGRQSPTAPVCKWCQAGTAHYRKAESAPRPNFGPCLTREEFGVDLLDAIETQASLVTAMQNLERLKFYGKKCEALRVESVVRDLEVRLHGLLDKGTIAPGDMRRLLTITGAGPQQEAAS